MDPFFESEPPFIIKVYDKHFEINWNGAILTPEDKYHFKEIKEVKIIHGKVERSFIQMILDYFLNNSLARKIEAYDEVLIMFRNGKNEVRYVHGQATELMGEAIQMINKRLNQREFNQG